MLESIALHNYHCFVDFKLELSARLLIVGSNGSGKTSLWKALAGLQDVVVRGTEVATAYPSRTLTRWQNNRTQRFELDLRLSEDRYHYELHLAHGQKTNAPVIGLERLTLLGNAPRPLYELLDGEVRLFGDDPSPAPRTSFRFNGKRSFLPDLEERPDNRRLTAFRAALGDAWLLAPTDRRMEATSKEDALWLERNGQNLASWLRSAFAERAGVSATLLKDLRTVMPGLKDMGLKPISREARELELRFEAAGVPYQIAVDELSDGQRVLLFLYAFLRGAADRAGMAFIDEPETGLAPHEMQPWLSAVASELEDHGGQLVVASHHPEVVDYLAPHRTVRFSRPEGGAVRADEITLETTSGARVSEWIGRPWAYEDEGKDEP